LTHFSLVTISADLAGEGRHVGAKFSYVMRSPANPFLISATLAWRATKHQHDILICHDLIQQSISQFTSKNAWSYTSTPQYIFKAWCLVKHRDNFTALIYQER